MPLDWIKELAHRCDELGIHFLSTPFDEAAVDALNDHVPAFKIASYELTHIPLIDHAARCGKPLIISTGAGTLNEIEEAIRTARAAGNDQICLTQCTASYPAPLETLNLAVIPALKKTFGVPVGLSDHSQDPLVAPAAAVAIGANIVEKHFTLSRDLPGPDHSFALEPSELRSMVSTIRGVEAALGTDNKAPQEIERELAGYRRGIYARTSLEKDHVLVSSDLIVLRRPGSPSTGLEPRHLSRLVGKRLTRDVSQQELLGPDDVEPRIGD
jgi:N-acetylneuraminate synthase